MENDVLKLVGARIRDLRKERDLSQETLGEKGGFHFSYIGQIERGEKNIALQNLSKIAAALEVPISQLFTYVDLEENHNASRSDLGDILESLKTKNPQQLRMVKNILYEIFGRDESSK
jgi:transcriptional regulator with XRE-family HTH domain